MTGSKLILGIAIAAMLAATPALLPIPGVGVEQAQAQQTRATFRLFFDDLAPHGTWVRHARYKYVWCPAVDVRWRPYTKGRWVYLRDYGWYFSSREPFAWAVYHYGRWTNDRRLGWCWIPGRNWAPAWVSWRRGGDHIGWAPLPPEEDGFQLSITINIGEPPRNNWFFIPTRSFLEPDLSLNISFGSQDREQRFFRETQYVGPVVIQNNVVINNNITINEIEAATGTEVPEVTAVAADGPEAGGTVTDDETTVQIFAPPLEVPAEEEAPAEAVEEEVAAEQLPLAAVAEQEATENPEGLEPAAEEAAPEGTTDEAAPAEGTGDTPADAVEEAAPDDEAVPAIVCPEGEELVEGVCLPEEQPAVEEPAPAAERPAAEQPAAEAEPAPAPEPAPAVEPAPQPEPAPAPEPEAAPAPEPEAAPAPAPVEEAAPAPEPEPAPAPLICPEGEELINGVCVPIE